MRIIGEAHSEWAPLRRKYNLFLSHNPSAATDTPPISSEPLSSDVSALQKTQLQRQNPSAEPSFTQFAYINEPFLSWDFSLLSASNQLIGSVNRNFAGFAREIFTDTGVYALRMDSAGLEEEAARASSSVERAANMGIGQKAYQETVGGGDKMGMTLDQRAVMLATAVTVDFDYFSRHSNAGGVGWMPFMWGGGGEAAGGAAGGAAGAGAGAAGAGEVAGAAGGAVLGGAGRAAGGVAAGAGEGAMAGAGTIAGYEAMQRGMGRSAEGQEAGSGVSGQEQGGNAPGLGDEYGQGGFPDGQGPQQFGNEGEGQDLWGSGDKDPWSGGGDGGGGMGGAEGGDGGFFAWIWSLFFGD
jgi:Scramblase